MPRRSKQMKSYSNRLRVVAIATVVLAATSWSSAYAQEQVWSNLTLKKSHMKSTWNSVIVRNDGLAEAFTPTTVSCPGAGACVVQVQADIFVEGFLEAEAELGAYVFVDGDLVDIAPLSDYPHAYKFQRNFMSAMEVTPGTHTIEVKLSIWTYLCCIEPSAGVSRRTLAISVYKP
jgi:hypothetical protein